MAHKWANSLHNPCLLGSTQPFKGDQISSGREVGIGWITPAARGSPTLQSGGQIEQRPTSGQNWFHNHCRLGGSPTLQSKEQHQQWPTSGQIGYITLAVWGVPNASKQRRKSAVPHEGADWLHNPYRLGSQCFRAREKISSGPQVGRLAT